MLRAYTFDNDEIQAGMVGQTEEGDEGRGDGGIDCLYLVVNGRLVQSPADGAALKKLKQNVKMELVAIQATTSPSFGVDRILRLRDTLEQIVDVSKPIGKFTEQLNERILNVVKSFRNAHRALLTSGFEFFVSIFYVSKGSRPTASDTTLLPKAKATKSALRQTLQTIKDVTFEFVGAQELAHLAMTPPKMKFIVPCTAKTSAKDGGYVALVRLKEFNKFITGKTGQLIDDIFDSNIRDYQGDVEVNREIRSTLDNKNGPEFWWLNNGITVLASKVDAGDDLIIHDPRIVNGLQTSLEINAYFVRNPDAAKKSKRKVLVRVIASEDAEVQDRVIKATNSQTAIPPSAIWATQQLQRDIEKVFRKYDLFYDRRKNFWKQKKKPLAQIVGMSELAQAVASLRLQEPNLARGKPGQYFKIKKEYERIFSEAFQIDFYPICAHMKKQVEAFLRQSVAERRHRTNLIFYVLMVAGALLTKRAQPSIQDLVQFGPKLEDPIIRKALDVVQPIYDQQGANDMTAKGPELVKRLKSELVAQIEATIQNLEM